MRSGFCDFGPVYFDEGREAEDYEILTEGHARYFESLCKRYLTSNPDPFALISEQDQVYLTGQFNDYDIYKDKGHYDICNDRYYYQPGFNISMILESYLPGYKDALYISEKNFISFLNQLEFQKKDTVVIR